MLTRKLPQSRLKREPSGKPFRLTDRDTHTFEVIQRHQNLPSHYLHAFTKHLGKDMFGQRKRLHQLWNEGYLDRPHTLNNPLVRTDYLVYGLTNKARKALADIGKGHLYAKDLTGGFRHSFMTACITANIELAALKKGHKFISQDDILAKSPAEVKNAKNPLEIPSTISHTFKSKGRQYTQHSSRPTEPDQLFGIDYGSGCRFFALETDRGTESIEPTNLKANSILRKLLAYNHILQKRDYRKLFNIPVLYPMFVTTSEARMNNMIALAEDLYPKGSTHTLFAHIPGFEFYYRTPPLLPSLYTEAWKRADKEPFFINKA